MPSIEPTWTAIAGFEGYYIVSADGHVKSLHPRHGEHGLVLKPKIDRYGYAHVCLIVNYVRTWRSVHSLVAEAFIGCRPEGMQVAHNDGNKLNNCVNNLRYATALENASDKHAHGTILRGRHVGSSKINEEIVVAIRGHSGTQKEISEQFGISRSSVSYIQRRLHWAHVA